MKRVTYKDTIPFVPPITTGKVIKVSQGNQIVIASRLPHDDSPFYRFTVNIKGIVCPEIRTRDKDERKCAFMCRDILRAKVMDKVVEINNIEIEKYGRLIADIYVDNIDVKHFILEEHLATIIGETPSNWMEYYNERPK